MQQIDVRVIGNGNYRLLDNVYCDTEKYRVVIHQGFVYDGATIPRSLWEEFGCPMDYAFASCVHDALYRSRLLDRKECDKIFHSALIDSGVSKLKAKTMYLAVRVGGERPYEDAKHMMAHYRNYVSVMPRF